METSPLQSENIGNSLNSKIGIIKTVLDSGNSVELPANGYSMFPTLRPGDRIIVKPFGKGELPNPGRVVVYYDKGVLVMHRVVEIKNDDSGNSLLITRGDSARETDKPWRQEQLLGSAISYKRRRKEHLIKAFTPGVWRYLFNHRMLWVYIKMRVSGKRPEV